MTFMQLISAGFGKTNRRQLDPITISALQEEPDGKISRSTQTRNPEDNFKTDGTMKDLNIYELYRIQRVTINDALTSWVQ